MTTYADLDAVDPGFCPDCGRGIAAHELDARKETEPPSFFCVDENYRTTSKASSAAWGWREAIHSRRLTGQKAPDSWRERAEKEAAGRE